MPDIEPGIELPDIELDVRERAAFLRTAIHVDLPRFINAGYSANQAFSAYQSAGMGINRSNFLDLFKQVASELEGYNYPGTLRLDEQIPDYRRRVPGYRLETRFREVINLAFWDPRKGEIVYSHFNYDHNDEQATVGEILERARDHFNAYGGESDFIVVSVSLRDSLTQEGFL